MSDVLSEFVAPEIDSTVVGTDLKTLLSMAQAAWNIALEPESRHERMIDDAIKENMDHPAPLERESCREFLRGLVARKLECFARYQRPIFGFQIDELEDGDYHLTVISGVLR